MLDQERPPRARGSFRQLRRTIVGGLLGLGGFVAFSASMYGPTDWLPAGFVPMPAEVEALIARPSATPDELRVIVLGASVEAGFPYPPPKISYARQLEAGLRAVHPDRAIHVEPWAQPALDSVRLVTMAERAMAARPDLLVVALGANEFAHRAFSGRHIVPDWMLGRLDEVVLRSRWVFEPPTDTSEEAARVLGQRFGDTLGRLARAGRPGHPALSGLPIGDRDRELLIERMRRSMREIATTCTQAGVALVFCVGNYGLGVSWPWGLGEGGPDERIDALVADVRALEMRGELAAPAGEALLERARAAAAEHPERSEPQMVLSIVLRARGDGEGARFHAERARDLDTVPIHMTGPIRAALVDEAEALGVTCWELDDPLLADDGLPRPGVFLDYGHPIAAGHGEIALAITRWIGEDPELSSGLGLAPLDESAADVFRAATAAYRAGALDPSWDRLAPTFADRAIADYHMMVGNFRDAVPLLIRRVREAFDAEREFAQQHLTRCLVDLSGRRQELDRLPRAEKDAARLAIHAAIERRREEDERTGERPGRLEALLSDLRAGVPFTEL
jgi:hypothetical protein